MSQKVTEACLPSRSCILCVYLPNTVAAYSTGNAFVVAVIRKHVLPTNPSPITTHFATALADMGTMVAIR